MRRSELHNSNQVVKGYTGLAHRAYLEGILLAEWWGWLSGRRRLQEEAECGLAGTGLRGRVWSRDSAWGALPNRALIAVAVPSLHLVCKCLFP